MSFQYFLVICSLHAKRKSQVKISTIALASTLLMNPILLSFGDDFLFFPYDMLIDFQSIWVIQIKFFLSENLTQCHCLSRFDDIIQLNLLYFAYEQLSTLATGSYFMSPFACAFYSMWQSWFCQRDVILFGHLSEDNTTK